MSAESITPALEEEINIFSTMPKNVLRQETNTWSSEQWETVSWATQTPADDRKQYLSLIVDLVDGKLIERGIVGLGNLKFTDPEEFENIINGLNFTKMCLLMPQETLNRVLSLAPKGQLVAE